MRIHEIIIEALSLNNTMMTVSADIGNAVTDTFDALKDSADAWMGGHDSLKGWGFISAGVTTRIWWDRVWDPLISAKKGSGKNDTGLQGELYDLSRQAGKSGVPLANLLRDMIVDRGSFKTLSRRLPPILISIGTAHGSDSLVTMAKAWQNDLREFENWLAEIESGVVRTPGKSGRSRPTSVPPESEPTPVAKHQSAIPGQNAAAEKIVNDILRTLPPGMAGDIRQIIAKSPNKIQALQAELKKRMVSA